MKPRSNNSPNQYHKGKQLGNISFNLASFPLFYASIDKAGVVFPGLLEHKHIGITIS
jgi:hypothetical protein